MSDKLMKIVNNEYLDYSSIRQLEKEGLIVKITYSQYVITEKGLIVLNNPDNIVLL